MLLFIFELANQKKGKTPEKNGIANSSRQALEGKLADLMDLEVENWMVKSGEERKWKTGFGVIKWRRSENQMCGDAGILI